MSLRWYSVVIDCHDIAAQARWWAGALDWQIIYEADDEADPAGNEFCVLSSRAQ